MGPASYAVGGALQSRVMLAEGTGVSNRIHMFVRMTAKPMHPSTICKYIGFHVNLNGPRFTISVVGFHGFSLCALRRTRVTE